jgi:hypothetical protein
VDAEPYFSILIGFIAEKFYLDLVYYYPPLQLFRINNDESKLKGF